jgi:hypothetical protein
MRITKLSGHFTFYDEQAQRIYLCCRLVRRPRVAEALAEAQALLPTLKRWQPKSEGGLPFFAHGLSITE